MWNEFGFSQNPYSHQPVSSDEVGLRLLVGRDRELTTLTRRIQAGGGIPTLEGPNGVGKTSLVSVAGYKLFKGFSSGGSNKCYLPVDPPFQLTADTDVNKFRVRVYRAAIKALHEARPLLVSRLKNVPETKHLYDWLNSPRYISGNAAVGGFGLGGGSSPNETEGFTEDGFSFAAQNVIDYVFPDPNSGGLVCVLDNLELLEESRKAREAIEVMRDTVLNLPRFIWVICGAKGIVRSVASSSRLQGVLADPYHVRPLDISQLDGLVVARIREYSTRPDSSAPVGEEGFKHLFRITRSNLRNTFKFCSDFSEWLADQEKFHINHEEKFGLLEAWLAEKADEYGDDIKGITPRTWQVFDGIVALGGSISPSQFVDFGFEKQQAMRPHVKRLEDANLVDSVIDEEDSRRKTITVTSLGWLINYSRSGYPQ